MTYEGRVHGLLHFIIERHEVVLSDYIVEELRRNIHLKLSGPKRECPLLNLETFLSLCTSLEFIYTHLSQFQYASQCSYLDLIVHRYHSANLALRC